MDITKKEEEALPGIPVDEAPVDEEVILTDKWGKAELKIRQKIKVLDDYITENQYGLSISSSQRAILSAYKDFSEFLKALVEDK